MQALGELVLLEEYLTRSLTKTKHLFPITCHVCGMGHSNAIAKNAVTPQIHIVIPIQSVRFLYSLIGVSCLTSRSIDILERAKVTTCKRLAAYVDSQSQSRRHASVTCMAHPLEALQLGGRKRAQMLSEAVGYSLC